MQRRKAAAQNGDAGNGDTNTVPRPIKTEPSSSPKLGNSANKPWQKSSSNTLNSTQSSRKGSTASANYSELEQVKQEILTEIRAEMSKMKEDIIKAIQQEMNK